MGVVGIICGGRSVAKLVLQRIVISESSKVISLILSVVLVIHLSHISHLVLNRVLLMIFRILSKSSFFPFNFIQISSIGLSVKK